MVDPSAEADLQLLLTIGIRCNHAQVAPSGSGENAWQVIRDPYIEHEINREEAARYGVNIRDIQDVIEIAIGGMAVQLSTSFVAPCLYCLVKERQFRFQRRAAAEPK